MNRAGQVADEQNYIVSLIGRDKETEKYIYFIFF